MMDSIFTQNTLIDDGVSGYEGATKKRVQGGISTSDVIMSSHVSDNSRVFPQILKLYVPDGTNVADITYGTGVFWRHVDTSKYNFFPSDLKTNVDARNLPFQNDFLGACVFDPPYMEGLYRRSSDHLAGAGTHVTFREYYSNSSVTEDKQIKYHDKVLDVYLSISREVHRVLCDGGIYIVKCQDEVSANRQKLTHVELIYALEQFGFYCEDIFVVTRHNKPNMARVKQQVHARKNHSYFLIFKLFKEKKIPYSNFRDFLLTYKP